MLTIFTCLHSTMIQGDLVIHQCSLLSLYVHKASCQYLVYDLLESKFNLFYFIHVKVCFKEFRLKRMGEHMCAADKNAVLQKKFNIIIVTLHVGSAADKKLCTLDNVVNVWSSAADKHIVLQEILYM